MTRLLLCASLLLFGCSDHKPVKSLGPVEVAPAAAPPPSDRCSSDRECAKRPSAPGQTLLCEQGRCEPFDSQLALRSARAAIPELASFVADAQPKLSDAPWYKEDQHVTLYTRGDFMNPAKLASACIGIDLLAHEGRLFADLDERGRATEQGPCSLRVSLGASARLWDNRCEHGTPSPNGGEERALAELTLSRVDASGLVYASLPVKLEPACEWTSVERTGCDKPQCEICSGIYLQTKIDFGARHGGSAPRNIAHESLPPGSCGPCLPDPKAALVPRLSAILARHTFTQLEEPGAAQFFVSRHDCDAHYH
jgi:hypothetical protein